LRCCRRRCRHHMPPHQLCHYCLCSSSGSSGSSGSSTSGLRRCVVAVAADSRMLSLTPVFLFFLLNVRYTWHRIHLVEGPSLRNSGSGIPEQINLSLELFNSDVSSVEFQKFRGLSGIPENEDRREPEFRSECTT